MNLENNSLDGYAIFCICSVLLSVIILVGILIYFNLK